MKTGVASILLLGLWMAVTGLVLGPASGQPAQGVESKPIGKVQTVAGSVTIEHTKAVVVQASAPTGGLQQAKVDDPVYLGDVVQTGADGSIGVVFGDGTSFNVSKNARMEINEFVYDPKGTSNSTLFSLTKGTFTFLAGKTAKTGNMRVETPVGTMGIRGTAPHVEITDDGTVKFTTLVEEHKNAAAPAAGSPAKGPPERKAEGTTVPKQPAGSRPGRSSFDICRNC